MSKCKNKGPDSVVAIDRRNPVTGSGLAAGATPFDDSIDAVNGE